MVTIDMITQANAALYSLMYAMWRSEALFSLRWWGIVGYLVFSYGLCFYLLDKKRLAEIILYGSLVSVFAVVCDVVLSNLNAFAYRVSILPMIPSIFIYDITALPLYYMLLYQYAASWWQYSLWLVAASAIMAFVFTPLMVWLGILHFIWWNHFYAFLIIAFIGFLAKAVSALILYLQAKARTERQASPATVRLQPAMKPLDEKRDYQEDGDGQRKR